MELAGLYGGPVREPLTELAQEDEARAEALSHEITGVLPDLTQAATADVDTRTTRFSWREPIPKRGDMQRQWNLRLHIRGARYAAIRLIHRWKDAILRASFDESFEGSLTILKIRPYSVHVVEASAHFGGVEHLYSRFRSSQLELDSPLLESETGVRMLF